MLKTKKQDKFYLVVQFKALEVCLPNIEHAYL